MVKAGAGFPNTVTDNSKQRLTNEYVSQSSLVPPVVLVR